MSELTDTLGIDGPGFLFRSLDQEWRMSPVGPAIRAEYSAWCKMRARQLITESRATSTEDEYKEDLDRFHLAKEAGLYNWGSPLGKAALGTAVHNIMGSPEGYAKLVAVMLKHHHGKAESKDGNISLERAGKIIAGADSDELNEAIKEAMRADPPNE